MEDQIENKAVENSGPERQDQPSQGGISRTYHQAPDKRRLHLNKQYADRRCTPTPYRYIIVKRYSVHRYKNGELLSDSAFRFAKNNFDSIRFTPENRFESIRPIRFES